MTDSGKRPLAPDWSTLGRSVSIDRAAELLGISRRTVYNRIRSGRLQTLRTFGGTQRVLVESLVQNDTKKRIT